MKFKKSNILALNVLLLLCTLACTQSIGVYKEHKKLQATKVFPKSDTVIIHLGGNGNRIDKTIELASANPDAVIVVSTEGDPTTITNRLDSAGVSRDRYILDFKAWDTLTNFALTYDLIKNKIGATRLLVVTDKFHIERSMIIATKIYYMTGVRLEAHPYMGGNLAYKEDLANKLHDSLRGILWRFTGLVFYYKPVYEQRVAWFKADEETAKSILGADCTCLNV